MATIEHIVKVLKFVAFNFDMSNILWLHYVNRNKNLFALEGPSWLWSYGSWIYNYLCNHCPSLL